MPGLFLSGPALPLSNIRSSLGPWNVAMSPSVFFFEKFATIDAALRNASLHAIFLICRRSFGYPRKMWSNCSFPRLNNCTNVSAVVCATCCSRRSARITSSPHTEPGTKTFPARPTAPLSTTHRRTYGMLIFSFRENIKTSKPSTRSRMKLGEQPRRNVTSLIHCELVCITSSHLILGAMSLDSSRDRSSRCKFCASRMFSRSLR
mmetsp:Transcript_538/g.1104  ORF Transcript_538/g.1104 Transcript_538/m.1104 type:complete len:205 (-) Transcript_538:2185-2799(-)